MNNIEKVTRTECKDIDFEECTSKPDCSDCPALLGKIGNKFQRLTVDDETTDNKCKYIDTDYCKNECPLRN